MISLSLSISLISIILLVLLYKENKFILKVISKIDSEFAKEYAMLSLAVCIIPMINLVYIIIIGLIIILRHLYKAE